MTRCEGYRRNGGAMSFGPVKWVQCENDAIVMLEVVQDGKQEKLPACAVCWQEARDNKITIVDSEPIAAATN